MTSIDKVLVSTNEERVVTLQNARTEVKVKFRAVARTAERKIDDEHRLDAPDDDVKTKSNAPGTGAGVGLIVLGCVLFVVGVFFGSIVLLLGGELLGVLALGIAAIGVLFFVLGLKKNKNGGGRKGRRSVNSGLPANKWAIATFILFILCIPAAILATPLIIVLIPAMVICSIIALVRMHNYPNRFGKKWLVNIPLYGLLGAAAIFIGLILVVYLFGF